MRQFGNVAGVSTNHYLVNLIHYLFKGAEVSHNIGTLVLTDFSKAFDLVDHTILIDKIIRMGVRRNIFPFCDFLHNRKQCVRFNNTLSEDLQFTAGDPQGTKLGPIGFQILINDAAADAESEYWKYVDDLTFAENNTDTIQGHLQDDLHEFSKLSSSNGLTLSSRRAYVRRPKIPTVWARGVWATPYENDKPIS